MLRRLVPIAVRHLDQCGRMRREHRLPGGLGPPSQCVTQPGQQSLPGRVRVGDLHQIQVGDRGEQTLQRAVLNADRDELCAVGAQRGLPFHAPVVRLEIVAGQHGHDYGGIPHAPIHDVDEVRTWDEVPYLQERMVPSDFQLPGDPGGPTLVGL